MKEINTNSNQFQNVLKKAIQKKPLVRPLPFRSGDSVIRYAVRGSSGDFYPVRFRRASGGKMLWSCLCAGAFGGFHCYHLASALIAHSAFVRLGLRPICGNNFNKKPVSLSQAFPFYTNCPAAKAEDHAH